MSKSPKTITTKSTSTTAPAPWLDPYNHAYMDAAQNFMDTPWQPYTGELVPGFNKDQKDAFGMVRANAAANKPGLDAARSELTQFVNGGNQNEYIKALANWNEDPNPYLDSVINASLGDITRAYGSAQGGQLAQFSQGGAFGGSAHQEAMANAEKELAANLARTAAGMRFEDYNNQEARQFAGLGQAAGLTDSALARQLNATLNTPAFNQGSYADANAILGIGNQQQANQQALDSANYGQYLNSQQYQLNQLNAMGNATNAMNSAYHTTNSTQTQPNPNYQSPFQQLLGVGTTAMGLFGNPFGSLMGAGASIAGNGAASYAMPTSSYPTPFPFG